MEAKLKEEDIDKVGEILGPYSYGADESSQSIGYDGPIYISDILKAADFIRSKVCIRNDKCKTKWTLIADKLPHIGKEVILLRGVPDGFCYYLFGKLHRNKKCFYIANGPEYDSKVPVSSITAWSKPEQFDAMDRYREHIKEIATNISKL